MGVIIFLVFSGTGVLNGTEAGARRSPDWQKLFYKTCELMKLDLYNLLCVLPQVGRLLSTAPALRGEIDMEKYR